MSVRTAVAPLLVLAQLVTGRQSTTQSRVEEQVTMLFDRFRGPLFRYLSVFRLNPADTEEVIQEVFLALFRRLNGGAAVENPAGWIFGAAHNLGLRQSIRIQRTREVEQQADIGTVVDRAPNPEDVYAGSEVSRQIQCVVDSLPEMDRHCILLRSEGLRYREIAGVLNISLGAVALSLARSLARIARRAERCRR